MSKSWHSKASPARLSFLDEIILKIGSDEFSRKDLMRLECCNFTAAKNLGNFLEKFNPKNITELADRIKMGNLVYTYGIGYATIWVWYVVMDSAGVNVNEWINSSKTLPTMLSEAKKKNRT